MWSTLPAVRRSRRLREELEPRENRLHGRKVMVACPYFDVVLDAQGCNHGVGERHSDAAAPKGCKVVAHLFPDLLWERQLGQGVERLQEPPPVPHVQRATEDFRTNNTANRASVLLHQAKQLGVLR